ncbi:MAG: fumarylacetoacetase [Pseudonocardiales bacterium]|nr:fumarylacetoacetase [Pseudonocardiales bacterium]MDT4921751.1 fumarylacetoacetase [Pseudonocardiales bacterium]
MVLGEETLSYGLDNLPYGAVAGRDGRRFAVVRYGDAVLDLALVEPNLFADGTLDAFLAAGPDVWERVRADAAALIGSAGLELTPVADVRPVLAFTVADYVDFYASEHHATNAGRIFRPGGDPLPANWKHMPVGYHGRAGSIVASGTDVARPAGVLGPGVVGPSARMDFEAELAFVVGVPGARIAEARADRHVFGAFLLNDWSARDIQAFETVPLGPFLGKSFATSVSPWITPLAALDPYRLGAFGLDIDLTVSINGQLVSRPRFADMHWTYGQMLAHVTSNGASVRTGDVFASGTVSGPQPGERGCLLELTWNGAEPLTLGDGTTREWLLDGDEVLITARAGAVTLGEVRGRIVAE